MVASAEAGEWHLQILARSGQSPVAEAGVLRVRTRLPLVEEVSGAVQGGPWNPFPAGMRSLFDERGFVSHEQLK